MKIVVVLVALIASLFAIPAGTANASICSDGFTLANIYSEMGDMDTAWAIYRNLIEIYRC